MCDSHVQSQGVVTYSVTTLPFDCSSVYSAFQGVVYILIHVPFYNALQVSPNDDDTKKKKNKKKVAHARDRVGSDDKWLHTLLEEVEPPRFVKLGASGASD